MMSLKVQLQSMFEVTNLGDPKKIVGIEIMQDCPNRTLFIGQQRYIESILQAQGLEGTNSVKCWLRAHRGCDEGKKILSCTPI